LIVSLESELGIDIGEVDVKAASQAVASNGLVPEGLHHAVLEAVKSGTANTGTPFREFTFKILAGGSKDAIVEHTLWLPNSSQDEAKKKKSVNQLAIWMHRLGLKKKVPGAEGKEVLAPIEGKLDFSDCLGTTCVIDVKHEEETWDDKKTGAKRKMTKAKLSFEGVLLVEDPRCKDIAKGKTPPAGSKPATMAPKDDFGDL
jgi:hypothetical protein